jgi:predicted nuclease of restriction endonuclease-like (RecB) superfamily
MNRCKDNLEREFYIRSTKKFGWTKNVLIHQIENKSYEQYLLNQTNFTQTLPEEIQNQAILAVKDEYNFSLLGLADDHSERELESVLVNNIRRFLLEMGGLFAFIGNQYRIEVEDEEYYIDLLLFHRKLQCLVAVELKIGKFQPEYKGKMEFYLSVLNDKIRLPNENDAIGIIICKEKNRTIVEYSLKTSNQPIGVATYKTSPILPENYHNYLPGSDVICEKLTNLSDI